MNISPYLLLTIYIPTYNQITIYVKRLRVCTNKVTHMSGNKKKTNKLYSYTHVKETRFIAYGALYVKI